MLLSKLRPIAASRRARFAWHGLTSLVVVLPTIGLWLARRSLLESFAAMTEHHGGPTRTAAALQRAALPVISLTVAAALVAIGIAAARRRCPSAHFGLPGSVLVTQLPVLAVLGLTPFWLAQNLVVAVHAQQFAGGLLEATLKLENLLLASLLFGALGLVYLMFATFRSASRSAPSATAGSWAAIAAVLMATAGLVAWRSARLQALLSQS